MSGPFAAFRKHQRVFMAVFGVVIMLTFVVAPFVLDNQRPSGTGGRTTADDVVATWVRGSVTAGDVGRMAFSRKRALMFLIAVAEQVRKQGGTPQGFQQNPQTGETSVLGISTGRDSFDNVDLARTLILAQEAEAQGLAVSNETVKRALEDLSDSKLLEGDWVRMLRETTGESPQNRMNVEQLFAHLQTELLAQKMLILAQSGFRGLTPALAFQYHQRLHRAVKAEFYPVKVADYVNKVDRPTDAAVKELFEKHKNNYSMEGSPDPGFKLRPKARFQYVFANWEKDFYKPEFDAVTEEEAKAYYDSHKNEFKKPALPEKKDGEKEPVGTIEPKKEEGKPEDKKPEDGKPEEKKPDSEKKEESKPEGKKEEPKSDSKPADEKKPADDKKPADEKKPEDDKKPADEKKDDKTPKPADQGRLERKNTFFVNFENEDQKDAKPEEKKPEEKKDSPTDAKEPEKKSDEAKPKDDAKPEPKPKDEPKSKDEAKPADEPKPKDEPKSAETKPTDEAKPKDETKPADAPVIAPVEYRPYEEVKDEVRRLVATPKAQKKMEEALAAAKKTVDNFKKSHMRWSRAKKKGTANGDEPTLSADQFPKGLTLESTPLVDPIEVEKHPLGKTTRGHIDWNQRRWVETKFAEEAYVKDIVMYAPVQIGPPSGDQYLYWRTEWVDERVPKQTEIQEEVVEAAKLIAALKPAQSAADKKATEAKESKKSLKEIFGEGVIESGDITWMTGGFGMPHPTPIPGVNNDADQDFMKTLFSLQAGQVTTAVSRDKKKVYVIRLVSESVPLEQQRDRFVQSNASNEVLFLSMMERRRSLHNWYNEFETRMKITWRERAPEATDAEE